jgi:hypothetical protein
MQNSFYVSITSDGPGIHKHGNSTSDFSCYLPKELSLEMPYEVALTSLIYDDKIVEYLGEINFFLKDTPAFTYSIYSYSNEELEMFLKRINQDLFLLISPKFNIVNLDYNFHGFEFSFGGFNVNFKGRINELLGTIEDNYYFDKIIGPKIEPMIFSLNDLYIYTDFIDNQIVNNTYSNLLNVVCKDNNKNIRKQIIFSNPQYLNCNKTNINTIQIQIKDKHGKKIIFQNQSSIIVKLHFKKK